MCNSNARHLQIKTLKNRSVFFPLCSLWDYTLPPPPCPVHLPLPANVIPGCCHVLHRPSTSTESVRGARGSFGSLPAAHETASVGLLDMVDNAVTVINHRWRHGASFNLLLIFWVFLFFFLDPSFSYLWRCPGLQTPQPFGKALHTVCGFIPLSPWKRENV